MIRRLKRSQEVDFQFQKLETKEIELGLSEGDKKIYNQKIAQFEN